MYTSTLVGQTLFLTSLVLAGLVLARFTRLDRTLACVITGFAGGYALPWLGIDTGIRANNIYDLIFYVVLPVLIFSASWQMKPSLLKRWLRPIFLLATAGVLTSCFIVAIGVYYGIGHPTGFPFIAALLTGAILAATDPSAVITTLQRLKAPEDLATLMEGESLLNDSTAIVLFSVLLTIATSSAGAAEQSYFLTFVTVFFGGILVGCIGGLIAAIICLFLQEKSTAIITLVTLAFASFYLAEHLFHVSGIMSIMAAAITSRMLLDEHKDKLLSDATPTWEWLDMLFTLIIFVLLGLVTSIDMFTNQWLAILIAIGATLVARFAAVFSVSATSRWSTRPIPLGWQLILSWGGVRGVIAIVLVLSLPTSLPYWWTIQSMVFGVVFFSLIVQGLSVGWLIKRYGKKTHW